MPDIVLHHYDLSPYAEKVRIALGIKRAAWRACVPPVVAPKPDLVALTGGYRRVPVMQIGADIFCDSDCIIRALDQLVPRPSLLAGGIGAMGFALAPWFTALMVEDAVPVAFRDAESVDPAFARDREELMGRPFVDLPAWKAAAPHAMEALQAQLGWIEAARSVAARGSRHDGNLEQSGSIERIDTLLGDLGRAEDEQHCASRGGGEELGDHHGQRRGGGVGFGHTDEREEGDEAGFAGTEARDGGQVHGDEGHRNEDERLEERDIREGMHEDVAGVGDDRLSDDGQEQDDAQERPVAYGGQAPRELT